MRDSPPAKWSMAELGDLVTVCRPRSDPRDFPDMPFVGMDNVEAHTMRLLGTVPAGTMRSNAIHFFPQDVLYGRLRPYLNKVLAPTFEGLASAEFIPLTPQPGIDRDFVRYRVNAADFVSFTSHLDEGDRPRVDWNGIRKFKVSLPPSAEQRRIVEAIDSYLTRLDDAIASLERVHAKLKAYRASVLKAAVEGRLVSTEAALARAERRDYEPADVLLGRILKERRCRWEEAELAKFKDAGKIPKDEKWKAKYEEPVRPDASALPCLPEGWCWATVDLLASVKGGLTKGQRRDAKNALLDVPYLRVANVQRGHLDLSEVKTIKATRAEIDELRLQPGDVLFNEGGDRDKLGRGWIWNGEIETCIHQNHVFRARIFTADYEPRLLSWYGNSAGQRYFFDEGKQTTNLASINMTKLKLLPVPIPPKAEQRRIVDEVERVLSVADENAVAVARDMRRCIRLRQAVLKWAFEGKLVDQDPKEEPADELLACIQAQRVVYAPAMKSRGRTARGAA